MLIYFILGMLAVAVIMPILDIITACIISALSVVKSYCDVIITRNSDKIQKITYGQEEVAVTHHPMGFIREREEEDEYDDL